MIARRIDVWSPAKVNLFLAVRGVRGDGYHLLDTVTAPVSVFDRVRISLSSQPGIRLVVRPEGFGPFVPANETNLVHRAASLFFQELDLGPTRVGAEIMLEKFIPVGAGLGGGSSNAAAVLRLLNELFGQPVSFPKLASIAAQIGADVPSLLFGNTAFVSGIGEVIRPFSLHEPIHLVLCHDRRPLLTRDVFAAWDRWLTPQSALYKTRCLPEEGCPLADLVYNDLEVVAEQLRPEIAEMKQKLRVAGLSPIAMSGSGSSVFGIAASATQARRIADQLRRAGYWAEAARTLRDAWCFHY